MLPSLPSAIAQWLPPTAWGAIGVFLAVNWMEIKASEARLNQRIDELKAENKASEVRLREEMKASEARQASRMEELKEEMKELRADNRALGEKMDRVLDALLTVRQA